MSDYPPIRAITRGPKYHWFGYYDKWQIDPSGRYALGMAVDFEHRSPSANDMIGLGIVDMEDGDTWSEFGRTRAWCWQQGCMLQWIPNSDTEVIFNDREGGCVCLADIQCENGGDSHAAARDLYAFAGWEDSDWCGFSQD